VYALDQDARMQRQQIHDLLQERELLEVARDLLLPEARVLRKEVVLPLAAEANLRQALAFEMNRQTPFSADEVCFDYRVLGRAKDAGQLRVELVVTLREPLERDIASLAPRGMAPTGVDAELDGRPAGLNLLPLEMRFRMVNRRARANLMLAGATVVLTILVMAQSLWLRQHQVAEVEAAIEDLRGEAMRVQQIRGQIEDASKAANFMLSRRAEALPTVRVLAEVTRVLPDDTYLDRLVIGAGTVQMQGRSDNAQQLIELINQSPYFSDASFRGPTRMDNRTQKEIFDVTANTGVEARD
jgi:general secretion pathway protein L